MSNHIVTNKQASLLDLSPLRDVAGIILVLRPRGTEGASRVVTSATAESDVLRRVKNAGWVDVGPADAAPVPVKAALPAPVVAPVAAPEPVLIPVSVSVPEPASAPAPEPEPAPEPAPAPTSTKRRKF